MTTEQIITTQYTLVFILVLILAHIILIIPLVLNNINIPSVRPDCPRLDQEQTIITSLLILYINVEADNLH